MGWFQFIQIAKKPSWHDSSLYLIQGLVLSVTSYMAKWWFLHLLLIIKMCFCTTLAPAATISLPISCVREMRATSHFGSVLMPPYYQCSAVTSLSLSETVWQFWQANLSLDVSLLSFLNEWVCECLCECMQTWEGFYFTLTEGEHWLVWCWTSEEARHPLRLSVNVELTFEEVAVGEGTTDLWILAGHKVTHSVSTQSASQNNSSQARDWGGGW